MRVKGGNTLNIFVICSKKNYKHVGFVVQILEANGHQVQLPNSIENPYAEFEAKNRGVEGHLVFKRLMHQENHQKILACDAVLVVNFEDEPESGYIGGATFLEMYDAYLHGKGIYLCKPITQMVFKDEINGLMAPVLLDGRFEMVGKM
jgi:hypothetical protein